MATACRLRLDNRRSRSGSRQALEASRRDPVPVFRGPAALMLLAPILRLVAHPAGPPPTAGVRPRWAALRRRWTGVEERRQTRRPLDLARRRGRLRHRAQE